VGQFDHFFFYDMLYGQVQAVSAILVPEIFGAIPVLRAVNCL
jgi:hypothetical protein